ncbi:MAG: class I SAM-dependent methyltransferase [Lachnospiraceae bacterium]|nr:class I SAM-dependent methyltransferase [Lachnospiraceae bacterium]
MNNYFESFIDEYADEIVAIQPEFYENAAKFINKAMEQTGSDGKTVLDIGNGGVINYNHRNLKKLVCADLSISTKAINRYAECINISFCEANMLDLSQWQENTFDVIIVQTVIHHLAGKTLRQTELNVEKGLRECMRILKPGGQLLIVESTVKVWFEYLERWFYPLMQLFFRMIKFDTVYQFSSKRLWQFINTMGFDIMEHEEIKMDKYIWLCRKKVLTKLTPCGATWFRIKG